MAPRVKAAIDWTLASTVLYVLLPPNTATFADVLGAFLLAQLFGLISHVPGGIGVFEGLIVLALSPFLSASQLLPALVVYVSLRASGLTVIVTVAVSVRPLASVTV